VPGKPGTYAGSGIFPTEPAFAIFNAGRMANPKLLRGRSSELGAYFSITAVVRQRRPVFRNPHLASCLAQEIRACEEMGEVESQAWVIMPNHVHWLFALKRGRPSDVVGAFKSRSARAINEVVGRRGRLWQSGFYDHRLRHDEDWRAQARYIVANPLRAGLAARLDEYPFLWCRWIGNECDL